MVSSHSRSNCLTLRLPIGIGMPSWRATCAAASLFATASRLWPYRNLRRRLSLTRSSSRRAIQRPSRRRMMVPSPAPRNIPPLPSPSRSVSFDIFRPSLPLLLLNPVPIFLCLLGVLAFQFGVVVPLPSLSFLVLVSPVPVSLVALPYQIAAELRAPFPVVLFCKNEEVRALVTCAVQDAIAPILQQPIYEKRKQFVVVAGIVFGYFAGFRVEPYLGCENCRRPFLPSFKRGEVPSHDLRKLMNFERR